MFFYIKTYCKEKYRLYWISKINCKLRPNILINLINLREFVSLLQIIF